MLIKIFCSCTACKGSSVPLDSLPAYPELNQMRLWIEDAGIDLNSGACEMLMHFSNSMFPATKQMLPTLVAVLQSCHASGHKSNHWYFMLQETIQNHFMAKGNCFFFGDAKEILSGEVDYDLVKVLISNLQDKDFKELTVE